VLREFNRHRWLLLAFASRDFSTRYRTSLLGWLWALAQPLARLLLLMFVFTMLFHVEAPPLGSGRGSSYVAYLLTGLIAWNLMTGLIDTAMTQLLISRELLRKAAFPAWAPVIGGSAIPLLQTGIEFVLLSAVLGLFLNISWTWLLAIPIVCGAAMFGLGIGLALSPANVRFGDVRNVTAVMLGLLFFLTPIMYPVSLLVGRGYLLEIVLRGNPFGWYVTAMHDAMYSLEAPAPWVTAGLLTMGYLVLLGGFTLFQRGSEGLAEL
jgi:ABC-type polysaccharide/polyol phosphate export permease